MHCTFRLYLKKKLLILIIKNINIVIIKSILPKREGCGGAVNTNKS